MRTALHAQGLAVGRDKVSELLAELHGIRDRPRFNAHLLVALHRLLPSDYVSYNEIQLARQSSLLAIHRPSSPEAAGLLGVFARHAVEHPVVAAWRASKAPPTALRWSDVTTAGSLQRLALYNEYFRPLGIRRQLTVPLSAGGDLIICLACNRSGSDFTDQERRLADAIRPHAAQALRNVRAFTRLRKTLASRDTIDAKLGRGTIALGQRKQPLWMSENAGRLLEDYFGWNRQRHRLPRQVTQWLRPTRRTEARPLVLDGRRGMLTLRLVRDGIKDILSLDECRRQTRNPGWNGFGLTDREAQVLEWVARGKSNAAIAEILGIRQRTVAKHLEHIFEALEVDSRTAAAAKALQVMRQRTDDQSCSEP